VVELSAYILERLHQDDEFTLYRGRAEDTDPRSVLLLAPVSAHPTLETLKKMEHEHALRRELGAAWAARPIALSRYREQLVLVREDPGGELLSRLMRGPMDMRQFLRIALGLAAALRELHQRQLIHKDVKPTNVLVDPVSGHSWFTGFGIASRQPRERQAPTPPEFIAGTLPYMAPEQTGRMNRSIDARSDLYSLGVTLYEALTGSPPFTALEPMEWVHCHIAIPPVSPAEHSKDVPAQIDAIVMKLLAKTAEDRYQTAGGLEHDLRRGLAEWEAGSRIANFRLGEGDRPDRLVIPEKLYGRAREIETLLASFDRVVVSGRPELVLVSGYSGIGKSSVVNELHKVLVSPRGLFASGKFEQYKRDIPYATLAQGFQALIRSLLGSSDTELAVWREALRDALGPNGRLIVDLVPELRLIIGEQPQVPELPAPQTRSRFQLVFRQFVTVFARPEHPLALFVDDLQWIDPGTLDVLEDLLTHPDVHHLLVIGAYRDNEVDADHPLMRRMNPIRQAGTRVQEINLVPLARADVQQLVADALRRDPAHSESLAQLIHHKTAGNPFFLLQFLHALADEGSLTFDYDAAEWSWEVDRIRAKGHTDNVVDLMVGKLRRLPQDTQSALQQLACLGHRAEIAMLVLLSGTPEEQIHSELWEAVRLELVERAASSYQFVHDRFQEAAYSLIPEDSRAAAHLRIGRLLTTATPPELRSEATFDIVSQLNRGATLITTHDEREQLAELNLVAGQRAKASAAYASALTYLVAGAELLPEDGWERRHDLAFALALHRAECEYVTGQLGPAGARLAALAMQAATPVERAAVAGLRIDLHTALDQADRAISIGLEYLRHVGVDWSPHPSAEDARREYDRVWSQLGTRAIEDLIALPVLTDPACLAILDILAKLATPAFVNEGNLHLLVSCRAVNLSLERGNGEASCNAYTALAMIAGALFGDYEAGYRIGRLGCELAEHHGWTRVQPRTDLAFGPAILPWTKPVRTGRDFLRRAFEGATSIGDMVYASGSGAHLNTNMLVAGDHLVDVEREAEHGLAFAHKTRFGLTIEMIATQLGLVRTLRGLTRRFGSFDDDQFDEGQAERRFAQNPSLQIAECWYWVRKLQARVLAGDATAALEASQQAERSLWTSASFLEHAEYHFYGALARALCCDSVPAEGRQTHLAALAVHQRQLEIWAQSCPENFENRAALIEAEIAGLDDRTLDAERLYEKAIQSAHEQGFIHNEAVACEVAARFYAARGFKKIADTYLREARYCYFSWGADGKVRQLDELYPHLKKQEPASGPTSAIVAPVELLDLATVIKVSQAISGEMVLEKLIDRLMRVAIEHAGAERGLLLFPRDDDVQIEAEASISSSDVIVHLHGAVTTLSAVPESVVRYVMRTHENVILEDASGPNPYAADPYFVQHRVRSVLCLPLVNQGKVTGALYLENNLTPHVFTRDRITVLKVLASQAAIALENTRLYRDLESREARIRRLVDANILGVYIWTLDGAIVGANDAFLRMVQLGRDDLVSGRVSWTDLTPVEWRERDQHALSELKATASVQPYEKELFRKDGGRVPVLAGAALFEDGGTEGVAFVLDLSEQKQAEAEVRSLRDQLYRENLALRDEVDRASMFEEIVGASKALKAVLSRVAKVAPTDSTVFITGETGTGKELIARALHKRSQRSGRAFVSVNCAALAPTLISSELFGHEKGAFTGAVQRRLGRFELAEGGTIFLDEVGELLPDTQVALLRVLQEREFERVGGTQPVHVDVRVIAATNRDLNAAVANGSFRQDLFYRLNVFPIEVPPLRERKDDILMLVEYFVQRYARRAGKQFRAIDKKTLDLLLAYHWPGNIRELQNVIERSVILSAGAVFGVDELSLFKESRQSAFAVPAVAPFQGEPRSEREMIEAALAESRGRVSGPSGAAAKLGIPPSTLDHRIKALNIKKRQFKFL
jgi:PAS domain S-box-containing protein